MGGLGLLYRFQDKALDFLFKAFLWNIQYTQQSRSNVMTKIWIMLSQLEGKCGEEVISSLPILLSS
jgi:hypothetical protein